MSSCRSCIVDKNTIIGINMLLIDLHDKALQIDAKIGENQTNFKSERLNNKKQKVLDNLFSQHEENINIRNYLIDQKDLLLQKFLHPRALETLDETDFE